MINSLSLDNHLTNTVTMNNNIVKSPLPLFLERIILGEMILDFV